MKRYIRAAMSDSETQFYKFISAVYNAAYNKVCDRISNQSHGDTTTGDIEFVFKTAKGEELDRITVKYDFSDESNPVVDVVKSGSTESFDSFEDAVDYIESVARTWKLPKRRKAAPKVAVKSQDLLILCDNCIAAIRSRGERVKLLPAKIPEDALGEPTK